MRYKKHVFVCINERTDGRECCGEAHGKKLVADMKKLILEKGLKNEIRINKAGCLDACAYGPAVVVYPEAVWYGDVQFSDMEEIVGRHLENNDPVERLQINFRQLAKKWLKDSREKRNELNKSKMKDN